MNPILWLLGIPKNWKNFKFSFAYGSVVGLRRSLITSTSTSYQTYQTSGGDSVMIPTQHTSLTDKQTFVLRGPEGDRDVLVQGQCLPLADGDHATIIYLDHQMVAYVNRSRETHQSVETNIKDVMRRPSFVMNFLFWWLVPGTVGGFFLGIVKNLHQTHHEAARFIAMIFVIMIFFTSLSMMSVGYIVKYFLYSRRYNHCVARINGQIREVLKAARGPRTTTPRKTDASRQKSGQ